MIYNKKNTIKISFIERIKFIFKREMTYKTNNIYGLDIKNEHDVATVAIEDLIKTNEEVHDENLAMSKYIKKLEEDLKNRNFTVFSMKQVNNTLQETIDSKNKELTEIDKNSILIGDMTDNEALMHLNKFAKHLSKKKYGELATAILKLTKDKG